MALRRATRRPAPLALAAAARGERAAVTVRGWIVVVADPVGCVRSAAALDTLGRACDWQGPRDPDWPPFVGGAVGSLTEDAGGPWLGLPPDPRPADRASSPVHLCVHDAAVCYPPDGGPPWLVAADLPGWSRVPVADRLADLRAWVDAAPPCLPPSPRGSDSLPVLRRSLARDAHRAAVERILAWIAAGDLYQLNLTLQMAAPWRLGGLELARRLWEASPDAAHAAYLATEGCEVASVSPETFLATDGDMAWVRPIKGTRPRAADPAEDAMAAARLRASAKDAAEHVMIVDLERNDLGRVCRTGSVRVPAMAALERHPTVWHLTSTVEGRLRADATLGDVLAALFPCGSVTGAPKRMAVARTRLLEPVRRGPYCGAIGVVSRGLVDLSVAIRTARVRHGVASYGAGGGIVADSDPDEEWLEADDKAAAFLRALGATGA